MEFGSIIRATCDGRTRLFQKAPTYGTHYWEDETGFIQVWSELSGVEVVRVGIRDDEMTVEEFNRRRLTARTRTRQTAATPVAVSLAFCTRSWSCRMADGHDGGCRV